MEPLEVVSLRQKQVLQQQLIKYVVYMVGCVFLLFVFIQMNEARETIENTICYAFPFITFGWCLAAAGRMVPEYIKAIRLEKEGYKANVRLRHKYSARVRGALRAGVPDVQMYFLDFCLPDGTPIRNLVTEEMYASARKGKLLEVSYIEGFPEIQRVEKLLDE